MSEHVMIGVIMITMCGCAAFILNAALRTWGRARRERQLGELQAKVLDKLGSGHEVIQFVSGDTYKEMLASGETGGSGSAARVLNTLQGGMVLLSLGVGMMLVSGISGVVNEMRTFLVVVGGLVLAVGIGLAASAGWSYVLLRRWGLLETGAAAEPK